MTFAFMPSFRSHSRFATWICTLSRQCRTQSAWSGRSVSGVRVWSVKLELCSAAGLHTFAPTLRVRPGDAGPVAAWTGYFDAKQD